MGGNTPKRSCELQNYSLECQHEGNVAVPSYTNNLAKIVQFFLFYHISCLNDWYLSSIISNSCEADEYFRSSTYDSKLSTACIETCTLSSVKKRLMSKCSRASTIAESWEKKCNIEHKDWKFNDFKFPHTFCSWVMLAIIWNLKVFLCYSITES